MKVREFVSQVQHEASGLRLKLMNLLRDCGCKNDLVK